MSALVISTTSRTSLRRLGDWLLAHYTEWRLHGIEAELSSMEREIVNRARQVQLHRHVCQELRVRVATLRN